MPKSSQFWDFFDGEAAPRLALRADTFRKMFEHLDRFDRPVTIIETGCARAKDDWIDGQSTMLFDRYVSFHAAESRFYSVDLNKAATDYAKTLVGTKTSIATGDSVHYLAGLAADFAAGGRTADLVYLDAYDVDWHYWYPSAAHHLMELCALMRILRKDTLVAIDDCGLTGHCVRGAGNSMNFLSPPIIAGKGRLVAEFAARIGAKVEFSEYQAGWTGF